MQIDSENRYQMLMVAIFVARKLTAMEAAMYSLLHGNDDRQTLFALGSSLSAIHGTA
jgi:hypothetical protein